MIETPILHNPDLVREPPQFEDVANLPILTLDEMIRRRAYELEDSPSLCYPDQGLLDFHVHSARSIDTYADAAAHILKTRGLPAVVSKLIPCDCLRRSIIADFNIHIGPFS